MKEYIEVRETESAQLVDVINTHADEGWRLVQVSGNNNWAYMEREAVRKAVDNGALDGSVEVTTKEFSEYANSLPPPTYSPPQSQETQEEGA